MERGGCSVLGWAGGESASQAQRSRAEVAGSEGSACAGHPAAPAATLTRALPVRDELPQLLRGQRPRRLASQRAAEPRAAAGVQLLVARRPTLRRRVRRVGGACRRQRPLTSRLLSHGARELGSIEELSAGVELEDAKV